MTREQRTISIQARAQLLSASEYFIEITKLLLDMCLNYKGTINISLILPVRW